MKCPFFVFSTGKRERTRNTFTRYNFEYQTPTKLLKHILFAFLLLSRAREFVVGGGTYIGTRMKKKSPSSSSPHHTSSPHSSFIVHRCMHCFILHCCVEIAVAWFNRDCNSFHIILTFAISFSFCLSYVF